MTKETKGEIVKVEKEREVLAVTIRAGRVMIDMSALDNTTRGKILRLEEELMQGAEDVGNGVLSMGKALVRIQALLEPRGLFTAYLNHLLWLSPATAYRYIAAYKRTRENLPEMVVSKAMASGMPLFGYREDQPFGKYTAAVKRLPPPKGDNEEKVDQWLFDIREKAREMRGQGHGVGGHKPGPMRVGKAQVTEQAAEYLAKLYGKMKRRPLIVEWVRELAQKVEELVLEQDKRGETKAA